MRFEYGTGRRVCKLAKSGFGRAFCHIEGHGVICERSGDAGNEIARMRKAPMKAKRR